MSGATPTLRVTGPQSVGRYAVIELEARIDAVQVTNPFVEAQVVAGFHGPFEDHEVLGFCDSEDGVVWRVRYCATVPGEYRYTVRYRDPAGTAEASGGFVCTPVPAGHGFVRRDPDHPMHFVHDDGTHVFLAGKTAWRLGCSSYWREFIDQAQAFRMNVLRVGVEWTGWPELGSVCWPWQGTPGCPDFTRFNLAQWRRWDEILHYAFARGLMIEPCIYTDLSFRTRVYGNPDPDMQRYWDYLLARWGAYPGVLLWELFNEFTGQPDFQASMARYLHRRDPYGRLVTTSAGPMGEEPYPEEGWNDILVPHHCVGSWMHLDGYYRHYALHHRRWGKPVYVDETGRSGVGQNNDDGVHRRKQYWIWAISGDYCNYHSRGGCYVTLEVEPGEEYWPHFVSFWENTEWWRLSPIPTAFGLTATDGSQVRAYVLAGIDAAIVYWCTMDTAATTNPSEIALAIRPGRYLVRWYVPASGEWEPPVEATSDGTLRLEVPGFRDDLAAHIVRRAPHDGRGGDLG